MKKKKGKTPLATRSHTRGAILINSVKSREASVMIRTGT